MSTRRDFFKTSFGHGAFLSMAGAAAWLQALPLAHAEGTPAKVSVQLNWFKSVQQGGHFVALEKGFFRDEGIDCEVLSGGPGIDSIGLVASGKATVGDRDSSNVLLARAKGIPVKGIAATFQRSPFSMMSLASKPVKGLNDMIGKTIAIPTQRRAPLMAILKRTGLDPSKVNFVPTGGDAGVLASGQVDAYFGWITNEGLALKMRGVDLYSVSVDDLGDPTYPQVLFATDETIAASPEVLLRFMRAEVKGWTWMMNNPEETARLVVARYGQAGLNLEQQIAEAKLYPSYIQGAAGTPVLWIDAPMFEAGKKLARESGAVTADIPTGDFFTQSLIRQAHAK